MRCFKIITADDTGRYHKDEVEGHCGGCDLMHYIHDSFVLKSKQTKKVLLL